MNLADLYRILDRYEEAEPMFKRALAIFEKVLGREHRGVAMSLNGLAQLYVTTGHYEEAESMFKRAIAIFEEALGPGHLKTREALANLSALDQVQDRDREANPCG